MIQSLTRLQNCSEPKRRSVSMKEAHSDLRSMRHSDTLRLALGVAAAAAASFAAPYLDAPALGR